MRPLNETERTQVSNKLSKYITSTQTATLLPNLHLHNQKIFHIHTVNLKHTSSISRRELVSAGTCIGKLTKTGKFRITVTGLSLLAPFALYKVYVKPAAEMNFLYGNDVLKAHVLRMTENVPVNGYVFVYNQNDWPIGFGVSSKSSAQFSTCDSNSVVVIRQSDCGEYLREQDVMF